MLPLTPWHPLAPLLGKAPAGTSIPGRACDCYLSEFSRLSSNTTFSVFFDARVRASSFEETAVALTPSGETVTTMYGIPDFGG
jgi:hypothetical protein